MFAYVLSVCVMFIVLYTAINVLINLGKINDVNGIDIFGCLIILVFSLIFPVTLVLLSVFIVCYILKFVSDKISDFVVSKFEK